MTPSSPATYSVGIAISAILLLGYAIGQDRTARSDKHFGRHLVGFKQGDAKTKRDAEQLARVLNTNTIEYAENPVCCLWVQRWSPTLADSGYFLLLQKHGGILYVTDDNSFEEARKWMASFPLSQDGQRLIPLGVKTTFDIIEDGSN